MRAQLIHFEAFLAVSETLSFTAAAAQLHMSPSRLSHRIQELESDLGVRLFERTTRRTKITPAGRSLLPRAHAVVRELNIIQAIYRTDKVKTIRVGVRSLPSAYRDEFIQNVLAVAVAPRVIRAEPLNSERQVQLLRKGLLDLGIVWNRIEDDEFRQIETLREDVSILVPDRPRFRRLERVTPEDVVGLRLASMIDPRNWPAPIDDYLDMLPLVDVVSTVTDGVLLLVAGGEHCALVSDGYSRSIAPQLESLRILVKPMREPRPQISTFVTWRRDREDEPWLAQIIKRLESDARVASGSFV